MPLTFWIFPASLIMLIASLILIPWVLLRLPEDYFLRPHPPLERFRDRPLLRWTLVGIKNSVGVLLGVAGLFMLVMPGQGLLTLLIAFILLDFPGKNTLKRQLVARPRIHRLLNRFRTRRGHAPFLADLPDSDIPPEKRH